MIINPFRDREALITFEGTRLLRQDFGLIGTVVRDPFVPKRLWSVASLYAPVSDRAIGGIRAKLVDQKEFVTFVNQMDLEVLLEVARPGTLCKWANKKYCAPGDRDFYGLCVDDDDLVDDLYDREMFLRGESPYGGMLAPSSEILRRIHVEEKVDVEEYQILLCDADPDTGLSPDFRLETLERRWARVERTRAPWEDL